MEEMDEVTKELYRKANSLKESGDNEGAFKLLLEAAKQGNSMVQYSVALRYGKGDGVEKDMREAHRWMSHSAMQGCERALEYLDGYPAENLLSTAFLVKESNDKEATFYLFLKAAEKGNAAAQYNVGVCYMSGIGVTKNADTALDWWKKAEGQGYGKATEAMQKGFKKALEAAEQGDSVAQFLVGGYYLKGIGVEKGTAEAMKWFSCSAFNGYAEAMKFLDGQSADLLDSTGWLFEKENDNEKAFKLFLKAAEKGKAVSQFNVGVMYYNGEGVNKNTDKAIYWWKKAQSQGYVKAAEAIQRHNEREHEKEKEKQSSEWNSAMFYYYIEDYKSAAAILKKYAEQGNAKAASFLARMYHMGGRDFAKNELEASRWLQIAAEQGDIEAASCLGEMYLVGKGNLAKDEFEAHRWLQIAAEQGDKEAQYNLGVMYYKGMGVMFASKSKAKKWWQASAAQGCKEAADALRKLT